jgi:site-specific recombinase XerD
VPRNASKNAPTNSNQTTMKVTAILKGTADEHGKKSVYIRVHNGNTRTFQKMNIRVTKDQFSKGRVKEHPQAAHFNNVIKKKIAETELSFLNGEQLTTSEPNLTLFEYCDRCANDWKKVKTPETQKKERSKLKQLKEYTHDVKLADVDVKFLNRYKEHLFSRGLCSNTAWCHMKYQRRIFSKAHKEGLIKTNPFKSFEMPKYRNPKKFYLSLDNEVAAIEKFSIDETKPKHLRFVAAWFVISCHTGLRYGDCHKFNKDEHIVNNRLVLYTNKTGEPVSMPMKEKLCELFARVDYKPMNLLNQNYNRELKEVQKHCKIKINLTAHVARHTFGVHCATKGLTMETTARLMAHASIKSTYVYYKITDKKLDEEVDKLF